MTHVLREWTVSVEWVADHPLTTDELFDVAEVGGAAGGDEGGTKVTATLTVDAPTIAEATAAGIERVTAIVPGEVVRVEAMTTAEADRLLRAGALRAVGPCRVRM